ncbi:MAG: NOP58 family protein [Candidatus Diapherotrites archaeon]|nr:NOP58 family protein [Candidatus Diapherotrites archaeon]
MVNPNELRRKALAATKEKVKAAYTGKDSLIVQTVNAIDDLEKISNSLAMRAREWYSLYFPELDRAVPDHFTYMTLVTILRTRDKFKADAIKKLTEIDPKKIESLTINSMGADLSEKDLKPILDYCSKTKEALEEKAGLESYLETLMNEAAKNLYTVAGAKLGGKLIAHTGSLRRLALMPSSTIQIIGAEKALFKHIKTGKKGPKHGLIFQSPYISSEKKEVRGKIARAVAAKISMAAKEDFFKGKFIGDQLVKDLEKRIAEIKAN